MRNDRTLTIASLLTLALTSFHFTDDALHDKAGMNATATIAILAILLVFLLGITEFAGRRTGYIITLLGGLAAAWMPLLHTLGPSATRWGFFFIWTMIAMGVLGTYSALLSARGLWLSFRARAMP